MGEKHASGKDEAQDSAELSQILSHDGGEKRVENVGINMRPRGGMEGLLGPLLQYFHFSAD